MRSKISNFVNYVISVIYRERLEARARIELANKGFADLERGSPTVLFSMGCYGASAG